MTDPIDEYPVQLPQDFDGKMLRSASERVALDINETVRLLEVESQLQGKISDTHWNLSRIQAAVEDYGTSVDEVIENLVWIALKGEKDVRS